jgi:signal peptidase I
VEQGSETSPQGTSSRRAIGWPGRRRAFFDLVLIVVLAVGLAVGVQSVVAKPYEIPSESMVPTLEVGQRVIVNRLSYRLGADPDIGDIVVFHPPVTAEPGYAGSRCSVEKPPAAVCPLNDPRESDENFIKRVVAGPGDRLRVLDGIPIVNGEPVEGDWTIRPCGGAGGCDFPDEITVPPDHYFMMGDNRPASEDSRYWGPVPRDWLVGGAVFTYWPPDRVGTL